MAAVQTYQQHNTMTLGQPQNKMYNVIQQQPQQQQQQQMQQNCVIVSNGGGALTSANHQTNLKSVIQAKRPLAPAPEQRGSVLVANNSDLRCKRKIQFMPYSVPGAAATLNGGAMNGALPQQQPASVARRNARERNRVKQVNNGFATLRQHIPPSVAAALSPPPAPETPPSPAGGSSGSSSSSARAQSKKLSKVETLRLAVEYIRSLQQMLDDYESDMTGGSTSSNNVSSMVDHQNMLDSRTYYSSSSPDSSLSQQFSYPILLPTPACSEASASPTPSHTSDGSLSATSTYTTINALYHHQDNYENYDPKSPEDEELLDAIFSWQQE